MLCLDDIGIPNNSHPPHDDDDGAVASDAADVDSFCKVSMKLLCNQGVAC